MLGEDMKKYLFIFLELFRRPKAGSGDVSRKRARSAWLEGSGL